MKYRVISAEELSEVSEFVIKYHNNKYYYDTPATIMFTHYYYNPECYNFVIFGGFENGILRTCIFVVYSIYEKEYVIEYIIRDKDTPTSAIVGLFEYILKYSEECNFYKFYVRYLNKKDRVWERLLFRVPLMSKYLSFTETIIPAGKKSSYGRYWNQFQKACVWKHDIKVKNYLLKEEFRSF